MYKHYCLSNAIIKESSMTQHIAVEDRRHYTVHIKLYADAWEVLCGRDIIRGGVSRADTLAGLAKLPLFSNEHLCKNCQKSKKLGMLLLKELP